LPPVGSICISFCLVPRVGISPCSVAGQVADQGREGKYRLPVTGSARISKNVEAGGIGIEIGYFVMPISSLKEG